MSKEFRVLDLFCGAGDLDIQQRTLFYDLCVSV